MFPLRWAGAYVHRLVRYSTRMKRIPLLLLPWSLLWLGGSYWAALGLQQEVEAAARVLLAGTADTRVVTTRLEVQAQGQQLHLTGVAHRQSDEARALALLRDQVRLAGLRGLGTGYNPVAQVVDEVVLEARPSGWGILAGTPGLMQLSGVAGSDFESQSLASSLTGGGQWSSILRNSLETDAEACAEADHLDATTGSDLKITDATLAQGVLAVARWGQPWTALDLDQPLETLRRKMIDLGVPAKAWAQGISSEVERVRDAHFNWRTTLAEQRRLQSQPPGHLVLALRGDAVLLRGELGSPPSCKLMIDAVRKVAGERRVIEEVAPSSRRKPESDLVKLATTVPPLPGGLLSRLLAVGTPVSGWKLIDLAAFDGEDENALGADLLPPGLDPRLVLPDVLASLAWIHSVDSAPVRTPSDKPLPFVVIVAAGDRVYLRGIVAGEAARTQIEEAARKQYSGRVVDAGILLDPAYEPVVSVLPTVSALPAVPAENSTGLLAVAQAGGPWRAKPMRARFLESQGLAESSLLPDGIGANQVMPALLDVADQVQAHLARVLSSSPGIPLQNP